MKIAEFEYLQAGGYIEGNTRNRAIGLAAEHIGAAIPFLKAAQRKASRRLTEQTCN